MGKLTHLVVDAGALIKQTDLSNVAENLWTTNDVLNEIKDSKARRFVARLPVELKTRDPSEKDLAAVSAFARLTGDFQFLSLTDLRIMALTYMFERETNGVEHIRTKPKMAETVVSGVKSAVPQSKIRCRYLQSASGCRNGDACPFSHNLDDDAIEPEPLPKVNVPCKYFNSEEGCANGDTCRFQHVKVEIPKTPKATEAQKTTEALKNTEAPKSTKAPKTTESPVDTNEIQVQLEKTEIRDDIRHADVKSRILSAGFAASSNAGADDDDGKNWVNVENSTQYTSSPFGTGTSVDQVDEKTKVGCITTDYSMQNVMLQMGLNLLSTDGMVIKRVKQWVLKCAACYKTTTELTRQFCPVCGNATLERVACSLDKDTEQLTLYTRANRPTKLRGTKFSLPMPKGGRQGDILLREDQLLHGIWGQRQKASSKVMKSAFGEHVAHDLGVKVEKQTSITIGYGRMNPNAQKGRERRGKKKRN
ncbi:RNA-binding protein NOB1 [Thraustotheca clavata]|uniref:RNA-binding protein NOB1 n=1 Tax=Thraustotheca clavata TaxID=74557 RepID=A0A1W0A030_9STRA|nr:RNA-binding protein NOB1 [Thraustotheca clavata]